MANVLNEETSKAKAEEIRSKNLKPVNPNIKEYLGSQKISNNVFGGMKSHRDNIVPYEKIYKKTVTIAEEQGAKIPESADVSADEINKAIKEEVNRGGAAEALADYPPEIPEQKEASHTEDMKEELAEEQRKAECRKQ